MVEKFHNELELLKKNVMKMGDLATSMLCGSVESLKNLDVEKAEAVISKKKELADMNIKLFASFQFNTFSCHHIVDFFCHVAGMITTAF